MKKLYKFIIILVITMILAVVYYYSTSKIEHPEPENTVIDPIKNSRTEDARVDELLNSFFQIYSNMVNTSTLDNSYLSDVVDKNSDAFKIIEDEINQLRKNSAQVIIAITEIKIDKIDDNLYVANVTIDKALTSGTDIDNSPTNKLTLTIKVQDGYKITGYKKVKA